jgi:diguanylate cyclase (GGDEF)-like protein
MPLHVLLDGAGRILGYGPTFAKLMPEAGLIGIPVFDAFEVRRPSGLRSVGDLAARAGERLRLVLQRGPRPLSFRGIAIPLAQAVGGHDVGRARDQAAGMILNLSFGIGVVDAVRTYALTDADFAATDLAVEMMYLVEAKTAAMETLKGLALRLQGDKQTAEAQALTDTLTGLRNRRALAQVLERQMHSGQAFGLMHIDLDFFKAVNDNFGHAAGDHVLRKVADVLNLETRSEDIVARVGGDEFVAVFPELTDADQLARIARRIIDSMSQPVPFDGKICRVSASIGITTSDAYAVPEIARMQHDADAALYASKRAGRGQAQLHQAGQSTAPNASKNDRRSA